MADINKVNYMELKKQATAIWQNAANAKQALNAVSKELESINKIWTGHRCNDFIKVWNEHVNWLASYLKFLQFDLAVYLNKVAKRFSQIDNNPIATPGYGWGSGLKEIKLTDESTLRFITSEVTSFQQRMKKNFTEVNSTINELRVKVKALPWDSTSSATFMPAFEKLSSEASTAFSVVYSGLEAMINAAKTDLEKLEAQNTKDASTFKSKL